MTRRSSGTERYTAAAAPAREVGVEVSTPDVQVGRTGEVVVTVTNNATALSTADPDYCVGGSGPLGGEKNAYEIDVDLFVENAPTDASVAGFSLEQHLGLISPGTGGGGANNPDARPAADKTITLCVPASGGQRKARFELPAQGDAGEITGRVRVAGATSENIIATKDWRVNVTTAPSDEPEQSPDPTPNDGSSDDTRKRRDSGTTDQPSSEGDALSAFWSNRSQGEKLAIAIGGAGLLAALSNR